MHFSMLCTGSLELTTENCFLFLCSLTCFLAPTPVKLRPYGAKQICFSLSSSSVTSSLFTGQLIAAAAAGECGQCHLVGVRRQLNAELFAFSLSSVTVAYIL